jgi:hypothetical protein
MAKQFVQPAPGRTPRHETTHRQLDAAGEFWEDTPYLRRRLRDGDVILARFVDPQAERAAAAAVSDEAPAVVIESTPLPEESAVEEPAAAALPGSTQSDEPATAPTPAPAKNHKRGKKE